MQICQTPVTDLIYCGVCSLPPEYCEFNSTQKICKQWLMDNYMDLYNTLYVNPIQHGIQTLTTASKPKDISEKHERKMEAKAEKVRNSVVSIKIERRRGKKMATIIVGLDIFGVELKPMAKLFAQKFATGASVSKTAEGLNEIVIQGEVADEVRNFILLKCPSVPEENIKIILK